MTSDQCQGQRRRYYVWWKMRKHKTILITKTCFIQMKFQPRNTKKVNELILFSLKSIKLNFVVWFPGYKTRVWSGEFDARMIICLGVVRSESSPSHSCQHLEDITISPPSYHHQDSTRDNKLLSSWWRT